MVLRYSFVYVTFWFPTWASWTTLSWCYVGGAMQDPRTTNPLTAASSVKTGLNWGPRAFCSGIDSKVPSCYRTLKLFEFWVLTCFLLQLARSTSLHLAVPLVQPPWCPSSSVTVHTVLLSALESSWVALVSWVVICFINLYLFSFLASYWVCSQILAGELSFVHF